VIEKIGLELEGGWKKIPLDFRGCPPEIITDLSIDGRTYDTDVPLETTHVGEIVSPPLLLSEWTSWLFHHYPTQVNRTCGLHVHLSVTTKREYALLMEHSLMLDIIDAARELAEAENLTQRHYLTPRLDGKNPFALFGVSPAEQVPVKEKRIGMAARYAALNYCFSMHGTLEYRLLPMFPEGPELASKFILSFLFEVEKYLKKNRKRTYRRSCALVDEGGQIKEKGLD